MSFDYYSIPVAEEHCYGEVEWREEQHLQSGTQGKGNACHQYNNYTHWYNGEEIKDIIQSIEVYLRSLIFYSISIVLSNCIGTCMSSDSLNSSEPVEAGIVTNCPCTSDN